MTSTDFRAVPPIDPDSHAALDAQGLRLGLVDTADADTFGAWSFADMRGFHTSVSPEELVSFRDGLAYRRTTGVWDDTITHPEIPVATVNSWPGELTVPGRRIVPAWAISSVTVAPTHRRRGIARALLEAELRTASARGMPLAMLTVSESTLYGRYGFAPAAFAAGWTIDVRRVRWSAPEPQGRVELVSAADVRAEIEGLHARARLLSPGQMEGWPLRWDQTTGLVGGDKDRARAIRGLRFTDGEGVLRGLALYRVTGGETDFTGHTVHVEHLLSETADAYVALWHYLIEVPLVRTVQAELRSVDEPLRWLIGDWRAASVTTSDHLWLRLLDVPTALAARRFAGAGRLGLEISDPYGYAEGRFLLTSDASGAAVVEGAEQLPDDVPTLALGAAELSALYLGGVRASTLTSASRVRELTPGAALAADALFTAEQTPWLSLWF